MHVTPGLDTKGVSNFVDEIRLLATQNGGDPNGSPTTVADILERWVDETGIDGFNLSYAIAPGDFEDVVKWLLPELRERGCVGMSIRLIRRGKNF
jgi:alkanesulfonate monooxygenase SsuD/methylene tetrahydromethanopterin reductase-like flavin-dependent oxidoreductase (luciferase family)